MGKRSKFPRIDKDAYMTTDPEAVRPLLAFFLEYYNSTQFTYYEPCVGKGDLIRLLLPSGICVGSSDSEKDARVTQYETNAQYFITNPPWSRGYLHPIIDNLRRQLPTWLLFDSDWMFTAQSAPYMKYCKRVVPVGRLRWIPNTKPKGKDNCAWYLFVNYEVKTEFVSKLPALPRGKKSKN